MEKKSMLWVGVIIVLAILYSIVFRTQTEWM